MNNVKPILIYIGTAALLLVLTLFAFDGAYLDGGIQYGGVPWVTFVTGVFYIVGGAYLLGKLKIKG